VERETRVADLVALHVARRVDPLDEAPALGRQHLHEGQQHHGHHEHEQGALVVGALLDHVRRVRVAPVHVALPKENFSFDISSPFLVDIFVKPSHEAINDRSG